MSLLNIQYKKYKCFKTAFGTNQTFIYYWRARERVQLGKQANYLLYCAMDSIFLSI